MNPQQPRAIEPADNTTDFDSGEASLDRYLADRALTNHLADLSRCYVCIDADTNKVRLALLKADSARRPCPTWKTTTRVRRGRSRTYPSSIETINAAMAGTNFTSSCAPPEGRFLGRRACGRFADHRDRDVVIAVLEARSSAALSTRQTH